MSKVKEELEGEIKKLNKSITSLENTRTKLQKGIEALKMDKPNIEPKTIESLIMLLGENPKDYFPINIGKLKRLKNKAKEKLESVKREIKKKHSELTQLRRFRQKLQKMEKTIPKLHKWKIEEYKDWWRVIGYFPKRETIINLRKDGKYFELKKKLVLETLKKKTE